MVTDQCEITRFEIAKLELRAGDVLAVRILGTPPEDKDLYRIKEQIDKRLPQGVTSLVYRTQDIELSVIHLVP